VKCVLCKKQVNQWTGLVCGNYLYKRGNFHACKMGWHASCYSAREDDKFPVAKLREKDEGTILGDAEQEAEIGDKEEETAFKTARLGDNFMCPFQCDICHFRNMKGRDPVGSYTKDKTLLVAIRRANIDAFWGRASSTVAGNFRDLKKFKNIGLEQLGLMDMLPDMGPFPVKDIWGMGIAVVTLHQSLDSGRN
jgi:hypothetical protein